MATTVSRKIQNADTLVLEAVSELQGRTSPAAYARVLDSLNHIVEAGTSNETVLAAWRAFYRAADEAHKAWDPCLDCHGTGEAVKPCCSGRDCGCYGRGVTVDCNGCDGRGWTF